MSVSELICHLTLFPVTDTAKVGFSLYVAAVRWWGVRMIEDGVDITFINVALLELCGELYCIVISVIDIV